MKRFLSADWHIGKSSCKEDELFDVLYYMLKKAVEHKCDTFEILGDLLDNRSLLLFRLWPRVEKFFESAVATGMEIRLMAGNHDFFGTDQRSASNLRYVSLPNEVRVIDEIELIDEVLYVPWLFPNEKIFKKGRAIFGHLALNGFKLSARRIEDKGIDIPGITIPIFTGHFHSPQVEGNIRYLGSPIHFTWSDANELKYGYILDDDFEVIEQIELNAQFTNLIKVDYEDLKELTLPGKSKVTVTNTPRGSEELVIKALTKLGAVSVETLAKDESEDPIIEEAMTKGLSTDEAIVAQIDEHEMKEELVAFHELLESRI